LALEAENRNLTIKLRDASDELEFARGYGEKLLAAIGSLRDKVDELEKAWELTRKDNEKYRDEIFGVRTTVDDLEAAFELARRDNERYRNENAVPKEKIEDLKPGVPVDEALISLKAQLEKQPNALYAIEKQPDMQIGGPRRGSYYFIELLDRVAKTPIRFADGKYTLSGGDEAFTTAFSEVVRQIVSTLDGRVRYEFFIRAKADERRILNPSLSSEHEAFRVVQYLRRTDCNRYLSSPSEHTLGDRLTNENLPILRAAYITQECLFVFMKPSGISAYFACLGARR